MGKLRRRNWGKGTGQAEAQWIQTWNFVQFRVGSVRISYHGIVQSLLGISSLPWAVLAGLDQAGSGSGSNIDLTFSENEELAETALSCPSHTYKN